MSEPRDYDADRRAAEAALDGEGAGAEAAFQRFRWHLWYPVAPPLPAPKLGEALALFARILAALGDRTLADAVARASTDTQDPDALYDAGYALIDAGLPAVAATVLARCLEVVPGSEDVVTELSAALERCLLYADAQKLLEAHPHLIQSSFLCRYLLAYNAAMAGDLATTRAQAASLAGDDDTERVMTARITGFLERADRVAGIARLDRTDLRGWHYVLTGGLLAHLSPYGFEEPMRGRYAWLQDSIARVKTGLDRLRAALTAWELEVPCVYAPPGRDHEILAEAASRVIGVPVAPWPAVGVPAPGLVVAYDLGGVGARELERLIDRRPGQIVYTHACPWTQDSAIAPEITTLLHQSLTAPWGSRLIVDRASGAARPSPEDDRDPGAIADEIAASAGLDAEEAGKDDLAGWEQLLRAAGPPVAGRRERLWAGSPVASSKFE
ncbi:MAG TPA: hypothetical protein VL463_13405 [Kofleriaceae bacterium]|nr:hypothetical protein [Kofleriaceae bacterium]